MAGKQCTICGANSGMYPLCKKHLEMKEQGLVAKNELTGKWELVEEHKYKYQINEQTKKEENNKTINNEITCLICGKPSNGKHFCLECWNKYKDKSFDIRITHCNSTQILDEYGNKKIKTKDGRLVRSLAEKIILDYFFDNYIRVVYEKTIPYINEKGEEKELHPDFYLKDYDLYIEFNGLSNKEYLKKKNYANKIYQEKGFKVEILDSKDIEDIETSIEKSLKKYQKV